MRIFNEVDNLCRHIRKNTTAFGGIQVVLCGDFYQLPPVPDILHGDAGESIIICKFVQSMHHVDIKNVKRHNSSPFIKAVREVATGEVSAYEFVYLFH